MTQRGSGICASERQSQLAARRAGGGGARTDLVVDLAEGGRHLVGERAGDDHDVGLCGERERGVSASPHRETTERTHLTGRGTEDDAETVLVVARGGHVHHLDGAACEAERLRAGNSGISEPDLGEQHHRRRRRDPFETPQRVGDAPWATSSPGEPS